MRSVALDWGDATGATGYLVHRRLPPGAYPAFPLAGSGTSSFANSGLTAGTTYCYRVQGTNHWGLRADVGRALRAGQVAARGPASRVPTTAGRARRARTPADPAAVLADLSRSKRSLRASRGGLFVWAFRATPSVLGPGHLHHAGGPPHGQAGLEAASGPTAAARCARRLRLARRHMRLLRARKRLRVRATVVLAGRKSSRTFTLKSP